MGMTNISKYGTALLWAGSAPIPHFCAVGTGSAVFDVTVGSLVTEVFSTRKNYTQIDSTIPSQVEWTFDYNSIEISGNTISEFGVASGSIIDIQDLWNRENFNGIEFDGTNELQIIVKYKTF